MNVQFGAKEPVTRMSEEIIIGGEVVGEVGVSSRNTGYVYRVNIKNPHKLAGLLQGHGDTKEEAITDALNNSRKEATLTLQYIEDLETKLRD